MAVHSKTMMALAEMASSMSVRPSPMRVDSSCGLLLSYLCGEGGRRERLGEGPTCALRVGREGGSGAAGGVREGGEGGVGREAKALEVS
jgi:hypothetical protein